MAKNVSCQCGGGLPLLGIPNCITQEEAIVRDIFVLKYDSDGNRNSIKATDFSNGILPDSFAQGKFDESDGSLRWNITPGLYEEVTPSRTDSVTQTSSRGTVQVISSGVITYSYQIWGAPASFAAQLNSYKCQDIATYQIDLSGKLCGEISDDLSEVYPRDIQKNTLEAKYFPATDTEKSYVLVTYQLAKSAKESNFFCYGTDVLGTDYLNARSMIEAYIIQGGTANTSTELYVKMFAFDYSPVLGYDQTADWQVLDDLGASITVSAVEELDGGEYKLTITSTTGSVFVTSNKTRTNSTAILYYTPKAGELITP